MDTTESSAPHAHPSTEDYDDTVEAHYACLERPCACLEGWVFVCYIDENGEEREKLPTPAAGVTLARPDSSAPIAYAATTSEGVDYSPGQGLYGAPAS